jgi:hypothetical protein
MHGIPGSQAELPPALLWSWMLAQPIVIYWTWSYTDQFRQRQPAGRSNKPVPPAAT